MISFKYNDIFHNIGKTVKMAFIRILFDQQGVFFTDEKETITE